MTHPGAIVTVLTLTGLVTVTSAALAGGVPDSLESQVEEVASRLEGVMDTSAQAIANPKAPQVQMTTCRIRLTDRAAEPPVAIFLYQEQALTNSLSKPYRQRFLQISPSPYSQSVRSLSFKPVNSATWSGFCHKSSGERILHHADLGTPVCTVFLRRSAEDYVGNTPVDGCPANFRGAVRITNHIVLHKTGMDTWDRGFDAAGKQVWGAQTDSYEFRKVK
jgi:hypothetical protein